MNTIEIEARNNLIRTINLIRNEGGSNLWSGSAGELAKEMIENGFSFKEIISALGEQLLDDIQKYPRI